MKLFHVYHLLIFLALSLTTHAVAKYAMTGCNDTCGNVRIPYPFGIGANCSVNQWYTIDCNSSTPYLPALNHVEVLGVNLEDQIVTVNTPKISDCPNPARINNSQTMSIDLGNTPFLFSKSHNKFVFEGCGNAVMMDNGSVLTGCSTTCPNNTRIDTNNCIGINCCQASIPHYLNSYNINMERRVEDGSCGSAFLVDEDSYTNRSFSNRSIGGEDTFVPVSLLWTLEERDIDRITCCDSLEINIYWISRSVDRGNNISMDIQKCSTFIYIDGTPYLADGCEFTEACTRCRNNGDSCSDGAIYDVDGLVTKLNFTCASSNPYPDNGVEIKSSKSSLGLILGVSISVGVVLFMVSSYALYKFIKKTKDRRQRQRFFKRNGGLLLKQQEEADPSLVDKTIIFTSHELEKATDYFNENRVLGRGGQGTVYKGMLVDGRIVAVKKSKIVDESQLQQFINEVVILSQVNHRNVVKLLGCCLETDVPLLVSEFIPNGTLSDCLHSETDEFPISLNMRLQIATEVAGALAYLHSATSIPIYHRDIKTSNILLDDKYRAKVSDFGTSRFVSVDQTHLTTLVKGTFGYLDPEYFQSSQFTEKSDVYSFGVVLVELLTGEKPISMTRFGEHRSLATHFMLAMEEDRVMSIFDAKVIKEGTTDDLLALANLATRCLSLNGKYRPTMKEVAAELETIRMSHVPSTIQHKFEHVMYREEFSTLNYSETNSTFTSTYRSCDDSIGQ
ncbi:wall-associated receptor kinase-like 22 [Bidens hawaiensis]|uniref:wall-associated receptor kinase-like 22 n=1 Tax=Bidens hawaiensis TaxID=980011 RepID=UPI00404B6488